MKNKPYKEVNCWKRHDIKVLIVNGDGEFEDIMDNKMFLELNSLKKVKLVILFDNVRVYESKQGALGIKEISYKLLERKGLLFKTVNHVVDVLTWSNEQEYELFIKWANHFRDSQRIQEITKLKFIDTYCMEVQKEKLQRPEVLKYIQI